MSRTAITTHPNVRIPDNHSLHVKLSGLRDENTDQATFRRLMAEVSHMLAYEAAGTMPFMEREIHTPVGPTQGYYFPAQPTIVAILRAGKALVPGFKMVFDEPAVGTIAMSRVETAGQAPHTDVGEVNLPDNMPRDRIFMLDPMLATGGSMCAGIHEVIQAGIPEGRIRVVSVFAAPEGINHVLTEYPGVHILAAAVDECLNDQHYIIPGCGDAGDRLYGPK